MVCIFKNPFPTPSRPPGIALNANYHVLGSVSFSDPPLFHWLKVKWSLAASLLAPCSCKGPAPTSG